MTYVGCPRFAPVVGDNLGTMDSGIEFALVSNELNRGRLLLNRSATDFYIPELRAQL
jgi:hypothetical protein